MSLITIFMYYLLIKNMGCVLACGTKNNPRTASGVDVTVEAGDKNVIWVGALSELKDRHEAHFTDIKIGTFSVLAILLAVIFIILLYFGIKKCRRADKSRIDRRALSLVRIRKTRANANEVENASIPI